MTKPPPKRKRTWTPEQQKAASAKAVERRAARKEAARLSTLTIEDRADAIGTLRILLKSSDDRVRQTAAVKLLEYDVGTPARQVPDPPEQRIVFETVAYGGCPKCSCARCRRIFKGVDGAAA